MRHSDFHAKMIGEVRILKREIYHQTFLKAKTILVEGIMGIILGRISREKKIIAKKKQSRLLIVQLFYIFALPNHSVKLLLK